MLQKIAVQVQCGSPWDCKPSVLTSSKRVPFSNQEKIRQQKERGGFHLSYAWPFHIQWALNPTAFLAAIGTLPLPFMLLSKGVCGNKNLWILKRIIKQGNFWHRSIEIPIYILWCFVSLQLEP